jgi:hypothetical protein
MRSTLRNARESAASLHQHRAKGRIGLRFDPRSSGHRGYLAESGLTHAILRNGHLPAPRGLPRYRARTRPISWIAFHTRSGVAGMSRWEIRKARQSASIIAFITRWTRANSAGLAGSLHAQRIMPATNVACLEGNGGQEKTPLRLVSQRT